MKVWGCLLCVNLQTAPLVSSSASGFRRAALRPGSTWTTLCRTIRRAGRRAGWQNTWALRDCWVSGVWTPHARAGDSRWLRPSSTGHADRKHCRFRPDPGVPELFTARNEDYLRSGWSRGHMAPAGDNKSSEVSHSTQKSDKNREINNALIYI